MFSATSSRGELQHSFRAVWLLWIVFSFLSFSAYYFVAEFGAHQAYGLLLASVILLQSIVVPWHISRARFASRTEAIVRIIALAIAFSGLPAFLLLALARFRPIGLDYNYAGLQVGYICLILLLAGVTNGMFLAMPRWRFTMQSFPYTGPKLSAPSWWRWPKSAILWIAAVTSCAWIVAACSGIRAADALAYAAIFALPGILLIAPISAISPADSHATLRQRVWKYARSSLFVVLILFGGYFLLASIVATPLILIYLVGYAVYGVPLLWIPCLIWAFLSGLAETPPPQASQTIGLQTPSPLPPFRPLVTWKFVFIAFIAQLVVLPLALLATSPASLGFSGIGCASAYSTTPAEYWFWQAYKGVRSLSRSSGRVVFRPATDSKVCVVINGTFLSSWNDPKQISRGYAQAARSWYWLIDPDDWNSARSKEIRLELALLLGRNFSSYAELQDWWNQNNARLVWSGSDEFLEVHELTSTEAAHSYAYHQEHPPTTPSTVETFRVHPNLAGTEEASGKVDDLTGTFHAALFDREARLRGLKLAASDDVDVLNGERERKARAFLESIAGREFATKSEWENFFVGNPPPPWTMNRSSAQEWIALIGVYGKTAPYRTRYVEKLRELTGLSYATPEDYVYWLQNPQNTRQDDWLRARDLVGDLPGTNPRATMNQAMSSLKLITNQSFDSPESWIRWWQANHEKLVLSPDGSKLAVVR